ncbi:MAG: UDP-N-acetylglucosamine 2-epimerase (non-hydrolyzing) [Actinomycetaceae bacterium]|nr:UDP-N-acetylglucosamine 2-epimerase (non-hydrolyzing) [Arcanobacterium sp.]MDD7504600.1 UDP-N-acetylglucosamine 2-epimerase (non-hydrolyzing) [Actinomycetaceae bacterium]MDY6143085.1 UDP-N-acetylglucosamine 2-epimerase (non-hydrolyzing) [Arcanobacterium sp.]
MHTVMAVYGTRPEGIKVAPVIKALQDAEHLDPIVVSTGQHREMLAQVHDVFGIVPDRDLDIFQSGQGLNQIAAKIFTELDPVLAEYSPDALLVQGDTTTVAAAAIAAFYRSIPVIHLEAGLRSGDILSPFPEEANRKITSQIAALHLAPTAESRDNLLREAVDPSTIAITGNTVIDTLFRVSSLDVQFTDPLISEAIETHERVLAVTSHRRENIGEPMRHIGAALARLSTLYPQDAIIFPIHRNPKVRELIVPIIEDLPNVVVTDPLDYLEFTHLLHAAHIVLTDSGGVQEEAPSLGKPVLVLRENTERPEAVLAGTVKLIGTDEERIVTEVSHLKDSQTAYETMARAVNPYGDGHAAERTVAAISAMFGEGERLPDFDPTQPGIGSVE